MKPDISPDESLHKIPDSISPHCIDEELLQRMGFISPHSSELRFAGQISV